MKLVSIITPVLNEATNIRAFYDALCSSLEPISQIYNFEIIFTDNDSSDDTRGEIVKLIHVDPRVRYVKLSRNFGYQRSIWTGYSLARGDAVLEIDVDLEDDPKYIPAMIADWEAGAKIVYGIRTKRNESFSLEITRKIYYRLLKFLSDDDLPVDAGDFMLLDRRVVNYVVNNRDPNLYIRGLVFSLGFPRTGFEYSRNARKSGRSKFNIFRLYSLGVDGVVRHSTVPLRLSMMTGLITGAGLAVSALYYTAGKLLFGADWPPGFATIIVVNLITFSLLSIMLGVLGEYILRLYKIVKSEPMSIIDYELSSATFEANRE